MQLATLDTAVIVRRMLQVIVAVAVGHADELL
jgi:hypothetical protein